MDKLKTIIKEYGRWSELDTYIDRIETHIEIDFSHSLENAKACWKRWVKKSAPVMM
ncbi:hypothetical protein BSPWISOXPB_4507 [uncultured Gammaproteobacteria bacterium]|nr:hypothetical protein BSPWISOXPB_4507 [uncultured Gammaproteobacteria bacterium]